MPKYLPERYQNPLLRTDEGYQETQELEYDLIAELESLYGTAHKEMREKCIKYLEWFTAADIAKRKLFDKGELSEEAYRNWRHTYMMLGQRHYAMLETMADNLVNVNMIAVSITNGYMPEVYALNGNYIEYKCCKDLNMNISFTLFDEQTVERLVKEKPDLLPNCPQKKVNIKKDKIWNKQQLTSAMMQGIIQGETLDQIAERLASVTDMNEKAAIRNARTMLTSAQNGGRHAGALRAQSMGIELEKMWLASLLFNTRDTHRALDGTKLKLEEKFSNGLMFPGDASGEPCEVYNCRCSYVTQVKGVHLNPADLDNRHSRLGDMTYEEWKAAKGDEAPFKAAKNEKRDREMHKEYRELLGKQVPKDFKAFQELKYNSRDEWKKLISAARKARKA